MVKDKFRQLLAHELYERGVAQEDRDAVSYEKLLRGIGLTTELSINSPYVSQFRWGTGYLKKGSIDLSSSSLDEQLNAELARVGNYFSSPQNQDSLRRRARRRAEQDANFQSRTYNGLGGLGLVAAALAAGSAINRRRRSNKSGR